jgi:hypothetical protein
MFFGMILKNFSEKRKLFSSHPKKEGHRLETEIEFICFVVTS